MARVMQRSDVVLRYSIRQVGQQCQCSFYEQSDDTIDELRVPFTRKLAENLQA